AVTLLDNRVGGDDLTLSYTSATFADKNAGTGKLISVAGISPLGADVANYLIGAPTTGHADITPTQLLLTAVASGKTYDSATAASATLTNDSLAGDDLSVSFTSASFADKNAGVNKLVTINGITL